MHVPAKTLLVSDVQSDAIDYAEIFATTDADIAAGRYHTLEATEAFGRSVIDRLRQEQSPPQSRTHYPIWHG